MPLLVRITKNELWHFRGVKEYCNIYTPYVKITELKFLEVSKADQNNASLLVIDLPKINYHGIETC